MGKAVHNNYITIAKALGIILMVIGHSGCPQVLFKIIYLFHMPLFFFCSGIFYNEISNKESASLFLKKRIMSLDVPFVSFAIVLLYGFNVSHVAEHPVIKDVSVSHTYWWILYCNSWNCFPAVAK